jgi:hypothetical protein
VVVIAYLLASIFLSVFSFAATTILHCYIVDEEVKGSHAPPSLRAFIDRNEEVNAKSKKVSSNEKGKDEPKGDEKPANNVA